ncbi:SE1832 family protein [Chryseomicrobium sp. FSL W7-1435]|uniref:SE1832 family protein n=1 Tax=Chryseomicrobium sp. FSL W7-1435 TaxID=2921704 RepID=UPI00315A1669
MTKHELEQQIAELKMDYVRLQGDMEKLESTGHPAMLEKAELRLAAMEVQLQELNAALAKL